MPCFRGRPMSVPAWRRRTPAGSLRGPPSSGRAWCQDWLAGEFGRGGRCAPRAACLCESPTVARRLRRLVRRRRWPAHRSLPLEWLRLWRRGVLADARELVGDVDVAVASTSTPSGNATPEIVRTGFASGLSLGVYSVNVPPNRLATSRLPVASRVSPWGPVSPEELPLIVARGWASPVAPEAYSVRVLAPALATQRSPVWSNVRPEGATKPVSAPLIVASSFWSPAASAG